MKNWLEVTLEWIVAIVSLPLMLLNLLGGVGSFIWLAILGDWGVLIAGAIYAIFGYWIITLFLLPQMAFLVPMNYFSKKKNVFGLTLFGFINLSYVFAVIVFTSYNIISSFTGNLSKANLIPLLIWAYCIAMAPWSYMASKEGRSDSGFDGTTTTLYFTQIGLIVVLILVGLLHKSLLSSFYIFSAIMIIPLAISTITVVFYAKEEFKNSDGLDLLGEPVKTEGFCLKCSYQNVKDAKYCESCGLKLTGE